MRNDASIDDTNFPLGSAGQFLIVSHQDNGRAIALLMNGLIMSALGYLFEVQAQPHLSVVSFARQLAAHQWFI
jgi:hypothetical protein